MGKRRFELSAQGVDDALQGITSDPLGPTGTPLASGLRVPPVLPSDSGPSTRPRYLFCLATRNILKPTRLVGMRQGIDLGLDTNLGSLPLRPLRFEQRTSTFQFVDGNVSWHLVQEVNGARPFIQRPTTDTASWAFEYSKDPAMLYETFTNSKVVAATGAPVLYMQNMTAYTPPSGVQGRWKAVEEDLYSFRDLRFPRDAASAWHSLDIEVSLSTTISLYASVLQTNPALRGAATYPSPLPLGSISDPPEEVFIKNFTFTSGEITVGPIYWNVFGALMFEDEI